MQLTFPFYQIVMVEALVRREPHAVKAMGDVIKQILSPEMHEHMKEVFSRPVDPALEIPIDLVVSKESYIKYDRNLPRR